ncbi:MAG: hypothetical protein KKI09_02425 [Spirochaetes bacterium]|nr:hypothetical protein [Spirochaetota bacterium]MBU0954261.1 hypothetical protein [Spirochaetota bacterium]
MSARIIHNIFRSLFSVHSRLKSVLFILTTLLLCLPAVSCQAPLNGFTARKADLSLTFIISVVLVH